MGGVLDIDDEWIYCRKAQSSFTHLGQTLVMVTHDAGAAATADRVLFLADGRIVDEMTDPDPERILDRIKAIGG